MAVRFPLVLFALTTSLVSGRPVKRDVDGYRCPIGHGLFADPKSCRRFYQCAGGHPYSQNCPPTLYFDDIKKYCTFKTKTLTCGPTDYTTSAPPTPDPLAAPKCNPSECKLPDCFCSSDGTLIPGKLAIEDTPQIIMLTFDGALNQQTFEHYQSVLNASRKNPNGCPLSATFFVSHEYTSYFYVHKAFTAGHEIAVNSISQRFPEEWWSKASYENFTEELIGMREMLALFGQIPRENITGMRAPFLRSGGNNALTVAYEYSMQYDSSLTTPSSPIPLWPYTLNFAMPHNCLSENCPSRSFPGIWEIPLNIMYAEDGSGGTCALADQCVFSADDAIIFDFLLENFNRHYTTNRAPMGLFFHVTWFHDPLKVYVLNKFIDYIQAKYPDVWFVNLQQVLQWMMKPTKLSQLKDFKQWTCPRRNPVCNIPTTCVLPFTDETGIPGDRYMQTCGRCPLKYPWVGNYEGDMKGQKIIDLTNK